MPRDPTAEEMLKAEKEIGKNIPEGMKGLDTEDMGDVDGRGAKRAKGAKGAGEDTAAADAQRPTHAG